MTPAELVAELRRLSGLTAQALALRLGVARRTIYQWEVGGDDPKKGYAPGSDHIEALARIAGVLVSTRGRGWRIQRRETKAV